jgi:hypothetical protein
MEAGYRFADRTLATQTSSAVESGYNAGYSAALYMDDVSSAQNLIKPLCR